MNYFAGLDVSLKRTAICIVDQEGNIVREVEHDCANSRFVDQFCARSTVSRLSYVPREA